ncbi:hypothetical protein ACLOJK_017059 [Asimina triloba]
MISAAKMTQDVEMKEAPEAAPSNSIPPSVPAVLQRNLKEIALLIETAAYAKEVRRILRVIRLTIALRRKLTAPALFTFLNYALVPGSEPHSKLSSYIPKFGFGKNSENTDGPIWAIFAAWIILAETIAIAIFSPCPLSLSLSLLIFLPSRLLSRSLPSLPDRAIAIASSIFFLPALS